MLALLLPLPLLSQGPPPDARWSTLETEHFRVTYHEGLEPIARRAAERAERAWAELARELVEPPRGRIDLVVTDNVDLPNGYATPFPTNRVVVYAHPPSSELSLAFQEDWMELVITHELVHIFHLDHASGIWARLRRVLGRDPLLFPGIFSPSWVTEGLATYLESRLTRAGRVRGTYFDMVLRTAVLQDAFFPLDRVTGSPARWPGGSTRYIYGARFLDHLSRRHGPETVPAFVEALGRAWVPYRVDAAARRAFGTSFSRAWEEWEGSLRARYGALSDSLRAAGLTEPELLTAEGRETSFPRYAPAGGALAYTSSTGRGDLSLRLLHPDGTAETVEARSHPGPSAWLRDGSGLLLSQLRWVDPYRVHSDLYRVGLDGDADRLTRGARVWEPDLHPDGRRVVAVASAGGSNVLEVRDLAGGAPRRLAEPSLDVAWSLPRWSPAGDRVAVGRWRAGGYLDVVVLDTLGAVLRELTTDRAVDQAPAWSPDGRYVVFSSDRTGIPNLFAYDLAEGRLLQVSNVLTGALEPDVSPDGRWIAFAYHLADGFHLARLPFAPETWRPAPPVRAEVDLPPADPARFAATAGGAPRPYSPWRSLAPASWAPLLASGSALGVGLGAAVAGADLVSRHGFWATAVVYPDGGRADAELSYTYRRWVNPSLDLGARQEWTVEADAGTAGDSAGTRLPTARLRREREVAAALRWTRPRWRSRSWLTAGGELLDLDLAWDEPAAAGALPLRDVPLDAGATLEAGYSSARGYAFSIGPQAGAYSATRVEARRYTGPLEGEAEAGGYLRFTERARAFRSLGLPGFAPHVLAVRLDAGLEAGSRSPGLRVGGASGGASPLALDLDLLGSSLAYPLRGYPVAAQRGTRAFSASAEYRFPLALVERGYRMLPLFLDRAWGDLFVDAGGAWCPGGCERPLRAAPTRLRPLLSAGAELIAELQLGFFTDLVLRGGAALPLRDVETPDDAPYRPDPQLYLRIGRSF